MIPETQQLALPFKEPIKTKYTFVDQPDGFLIQRQGGIELKVAYKDTYLDLTDNRGGDIPSHCGLYGSQLLYEISNRLVELVMGRGKRYVRAADRREGRDMMKRALGGRVNLACQRVWKEIVPSDVEVLARLMWSSAFTDAAVLHVPDLYTESWKYLYSDLLKYSACRLFARHSYDAVYNYDPLDVLRTVATWRTVLSQNALSPKAMNKTLDDFPKGISYHSITNLADVRLERPLKGRLKVIAVLSGVRHHHYAQHERLLLAAQTSEIIEAATVVGFAIGSQSRQETISAAVGHILDCPDRAPSFLALARASRAWHDRPERFRLITTRQDIPRDTLLAVPDVDLDRLSEKGITLLRTAGQVEDEGDLMKHCVWNAGYAQKAARGECYLFHVHLEKAGIGHGATAEVSPQGVILQVNGPDHVDNPACSYGRSVLSAAFKVAKEKSRESRTEDRA